VFQVHGAAADGSVLFRKKLSRPQFARFMADQPPCLVAMEACASAHHWAREMARHGHEVRLIAPHYVKPFLKRQKNDAADAEAIVEAALRPTMRFVEPKSSDQQARAVAFRTREQLVKQRTEAVNALRSHLYEFGHVAPEGIGYPVPAYAAILDRKGGNGEGSLIPGSLARLRGQGLPGPDQLAHRGYPHLPLGVTAMQLDRDFANTEVEGDLLIDTAACHFLEDLVLSRCQGLQP